MTPTLADSYAISCYFPLQTAIVKYIPNSRMLWVTISMQGIGTVAIDGPRFEEFLRSRKDFAIGLHSLVNGLFSIFIFPFEKSFRMNQMLFP